MTPPRTKRPAKDGSRRGRPPGSLNKKTVEKEYARAQLRAMVFAQLQPLVQAQIANAQGLKYLVAREKGTGKFIRVGQALASETDYETIEVWEKDPSVNAFTDLMNRTLDKPVDAVEMTHQGGLEITWRSE